MSTTPPRRPSTLAADRLSAAKRPLAWTPSTRASARPAEAPMTGPVRTKAAAGVPGRVPIRPSLAKKQATKSQQDGQIVTSVIIAFVLVILVVASVSVRGSMRANKSVAAVTGTLKTVHARQSTFRLLNQRFATWSELEARGMRLPVDQAVVKSNASASHWFVSLRDSATGVICDKTGELFDEGPNDHQPVCREPGK